MFAQLGSAGAGLQRILDLAAESESPQRVEALRLLDELQHIDATWLGPRPTEPLRAIDLVGTRGTLLRLARVAV